MSTLPGPYSVAGKRRISVVVESQTDPVLSYFSEVKALLKRLFCVRFSLVFAVWKRIVIAKVYQRSTPYLVSSGALIVRVLVRFEGDCEG